jgi:hypothetical protein
MTKSKMRWMGHVTQITEMKNACRIQPETVKRRVQLEDLDLDRRIILKLIMKK